MGCQVTGDAREFRHILGHYPTGVCAITAIAGNGKPVGLIVGSFTSVSLDPPLVGFFPDKSSTSWPQVEATGRFCVNILGDCQQGVCRSLAAKGDDKFADVSFSRSALGSPIIDGAIAWIDCELDTVHEAGDHFFVLGRVHGLGLHHEGSPMIFHKGGYSGLLPA